MTKAILGLIPTMQSLSLASHNYGLLKKRKKKTGDFIKHGVGNIVGIEMLKETGNIIESY